MSLWDMFSLIKFITNKDFSGNIITPERFKELIKVTNIDLFRNKYGLPEEYQPGRPVPSEFADITIKNTDDLKAFKVFLPNTPVNAGVLPFPSNYAHRNTVTYNFSKTINGAPTILPKPVEILREAEFASRNGNYTKRPTTSNPIGVMRNNGIHIRPLTITSADFNYYRWPIAPVFSYTMGDGYIEYNASGSVEFEYPPDEGITLVRMMLSYISINLRESDILNYSEMKLKQG